MMKGGIGGMELRKIPYFFLNLTLIRLEVVLSAWHYLIVSPPHVSSQVILVMQIMVWNHWS